MESREKSANLPLNPQKYEKIFINYMNEMKMKGKQWRSARNSLLLKILCIPPKYLIEIKKKYSFNKY
ncbi:MAG: hypothetical protein ACTSO2_14730 [Promethearchaeota archaeon]